MRVFIPVTFKLFQYKACANLFHRIRPLNILTMTLLSEGYLAKSRALVHIITQCRWVPKMIPQLAARGRGYSIFSSYVGFDPVSTIYPQKLSGISSTPKIFEILPPPPPPKLSTFCTFTEIKDPYIRRNDP